MVDRTDDSVGGSVDRRLKKFVLIAGELRECSCVQYFEGFENTARAKWCSFIIVALLLGQVEDGARRVATVRVSFFPCKKERRRRGGWWIAGLSHRLFSGGVEG